MRIERGEVVRSGRNEREPSRVVGIRASAEFWDKVQEFADGKGDSKNLLVIKAIVEYMEKHDGAI